MKKLVPLLALAVTACKPATLDRDLKDIPGLAFHALHEGASDESVLLKYDSTAGSSCYRIPAETTLTVNGEAFTLDKRGALYETSSGYFGCDFPRFKGPARPAGEPLTEYVLSDGASTLRAAFKELHATRSFRVKVNGKEQTSLRNGSSVDIEWLPVSDVLESAQVAFRLAGTPEGEEDTYTIQGLRLDANHIRFVLDVRTIGDFTLRVTTRGQAGLEACEGFTSCRADFVEELRVPMPID
ncbi:hypothetical protein ATI61_105616 [Archangium gephyra]|uniref:Lipoprotein n=1 Tax=Archangium gephyra TaxID=48 RepID=A0AAC8QES5_9BACT|nr:hypothetical protein [Archangium gephyra]AKJ06397.1 Hypothetical protein AA314_08023 [Archangium gephyra]REG32288.1 hypothetical protein ATI61_105616 [Archangium gephyra]